jgi:hypothetical protein
MKQKRIVTGNKAFHANAALFTSKLISKNAKLRLHNSEILRNIYGLSKEMDNTWRIRRND